MSNISGLKQWFGERFPPMNFISGFFLYLLPKSLACLAENATWSYRDVLAALIPAMHLFMLRVFDEHKDFESDKIFNPQRVLQRGVVSLAQVRTLGFIAFAIQLLCLLCLLPDLAVILWYGAVWIWTILMWKEFFAKDWLKQHYLLYAILHLIITPLILVLCLKIANAPVHFWLYLFSLGFLTGWIYEVSRKTKAPAEETGDSSYSKIWGIRTSCIVIAVQGFATMGVGAYLFEELGIWNWTTEIIFAAVLTLHLLAVYGFQKSPSPKGRKANEGTSALAGLAIFLIPLTAIFWH